MVAFNNIEQNGLPIMPHDIGKHWHQDPVVRQKGHPYYHWFQTESGVGEFFVRDQRFELTPGMGIIIAPGVPHHYRSTMVKKEWRINFATFQGPLVHQFSDYLGDTEYILLEPDEGRRQEQLVDRIFYGVQTHNIPIERISTLTYDFFIQLGSYQQSKLQSKTGDDYDRYIVPVIKYINEHIADEIQIADLADIPYISPQYLRRLFHEYLGMAPTQYILQARIKHAKGLLLNKHNLKIAEIALQSGFTDARYFARMFKREVGQTPLAYRKWQQ